MKRTPTIFAALLALACLVASGSVASANDDPPGLWAGPFGSTYARSDQDDARDAVRSGQYISMEQALSTVRSRYPGRLLDAGFNRGSGVYNIKMLSDGEVLLVAVNARTGSIMNVRRGGR